MSGLALTKDHSAATAVNGVAAPRDAMATLGAGSTPMTTAVPMIVRILFICYFHTS